MWINRSKKVDICAVVMSGSLPVRKESRPGRDKEADVGIFL